MENKAAIMIIHSTYFGGSDDASREYKACECFEAFKVKTVTLIMLRYSMLEDSTTSVIVGECSQNCGRKGRRN